jgi:radical SAM family uncharacterized protein
MRWEITVSSYGASSNVSFGMSKSTWYNGGMTTIDQMLDRILPAVTRPARYTGHEWNARLKPWEGASVRFALAYPDTYEVGMSNLGFQILYEIANDLPDVLCDRAYAPWVDMEQAMREAGVPLFGLESRRPLADFDLIGFSLPYELNATNVLNMLDLAGLPILAAQRSGRQPLIVAGGSGAFNPEPMAEFFDLVVVGDGEEALADLLMTYRNWRASAGLDAPSRDFLPIAAGIEGVYVPAFYAPRYDAAGLLVATEPIHPAAPERICRRVVRELPDAPIRPPLPYLDIVHNRAMIEIQRGCTQGCRFCQAGMIYRPVRERTAEEIHDLADALLAHTGYEELGLLSLSSADHSEIEQIVSGLVSRFEGQPLSLSLPSLRLDSFSVDLARMIQTRRRSGLTFAPEAGSQRLRDAINKKVSEEDLLRTAEAAFSNGWHRIKLYFMIGLPTETVEDVAAIGDLVRKVRAIGKEKAGGRAQVAVSVSTFVPKPHTPFQWMPLIEERELLHRIGVLRDATRAKGIHLSWHEPITTALEAAIARGDRRLGPIIARAWQLGARFDAWNEHFKPLAWTQAYAEAGLSIDFFARRHRAADETLPWDHIDAGVTRAFLLEEQERALLGEPLSDCREVCHGCGIRTRFDLADCPSTAVSRREVVAR